MPQTISMQRGSITVASNGAVTTLFTNGTGMFATRVIVNAILITTSSSTGANGKLNGVGGALVVTPSGLSGTYLVGILPQSNNGAAFAQLPVNGLTSGAVSSAGSSSTTVVAVSATPIYGSTGTNNSFTTGNVTGNVTASSANTGSLSNGITAQAGYCPQNFWVGPSDAIRFAPKLSQSFTAAAGKSPQVNYTDSYTVFYSFTLISET
jgi:hypothetical protein